jgi:peptide/nickel transport system substrate-binding protein
MNEKDALVMPSNGISRRRYLEAMSLAGAAGLAGCGAGGGGGDGGDGGGGGDGGDGGGGGGGDGGDTATAESGTAGERVPTLALEYWSNTGTRTSIHEDILPIAQNNLSEIGIELNIKPVSFTTQLNHVFQDQRNHHIALWGHSQPPDRLDPSEFAFRFNAYWAGANGRGNPTNFADCEHTLAGDQVRRTGGDARREANRNAHARMSEEVNAIPVTPAIRYGGYNENAVNPGGLGQMKLQSAAWKALVDSEATTDRGLVINHLPVLAETKTYQVLNDAALVFFWSNVMFSPLVSYDENFELVNVLAESRNMNSDATEFSFTLKEGLTFANGDELTAEDVKWTLEFIGEMADNFGKFQSPPYQEITTDGRTVDITMETAFPALMTRNIPRIGIYPKDQFEEAGARDSPQSFMADVDLGTAGSGPFRVTNFQQGQLIQMEPHEGHPYEATSNLSIRVYDQIQTAFRDFQGGTLNMIHLLPPSIAKEQLTNVEGASATVSNGFMHDVVFYPQWPWGPQNHQAFRMAFSQALNRQAMAETGQYGDAEPHLHSITIPPNHPWYPGTEGMTKIAETPQANPDVARSVLEDAGWSFDDNGRLRYPSDIDLEPAWPEGEQPQDYPEQWPCVEEVARGG